MLGGRVMPQTQGRKCLAVSLQLILCLVHCCSTAASPHARQTQWMVSWRSCIWHCRSLDLFPTDTHPSPSSLMIERWHFLLECVTAQIVISESWLMCMWSHRYVFYSLASFLTCFFSAPCKFPRILIIKRHDLTIKLVKLYPQCCFIEEGRYIK